MFIVRVSVCPVHTAALTIKLTLTLTMDPKNYYVAQKCAGFTFRHRLEQRFDIFSIFQHRFWAAGHIFPVTMLQFPRDREGSRRVPPWRQRRRWGRNSGKWSRNQQLSWPTAVRRQESHQEPLGTTLRINIWYLIDTQPRHGVTVQEEDGGRWVCELLANLFVALVYWLFWLLTVLVTDCCCVSSLLFMLTS